MGNKVSKDRFSLLVCANAAGEKEKLLVIRKSKKSHLFPKYNSDLSHHVTYRSNKCGWMTTAIFTEFLNSLNNKMKYQGCHILMFLDNCSSYPHVHLSNIKLVFYLKNTTSRLQAMDQGVIASLKKNYDKCMLNFRCHCTCESSLETSHPDCIIKCFKQSGIMEQIIPPSPPPSPVHVSEDDKFANYFQDLLDFPWEEYSAMDEDLECEEPARAPNTLAYCIDDQDTDRDHEKDNQSEPAPIQSEIVLGYLMNIQKSNLDDIKLFDLLEQAMAHIQSKKTITKLINKMFSHHCINSL